MILCKEKMAIVSPVHVLIHSVIRKKGLFTNGSIVSIVNEFMRQREEDAA